MSAQKHDHRQSMWLICGGHWIWCYQCGAIRTNTPGRAVWDKPTGIGGPNPAMADLDRSNVTGKEPIKQRHGRMKKR